MMWTLPNLLTVGRLIAAPFVALVFVFLPHPVSDWAALVLFVGASLTDYLDGWLARAWNQQSRFGTMADPIADKAMVITALAVVMGLSSMSGWVLVPAAVILLREIFVSGLREFLGADAGRLAVTKLAKWKTTVQMVAIALVLASHALRSGTVMIAGLLLLWLAGVLTAITGWDYFSKARPFLKERPKA